MATSIKQATKTQGKEIMSNITNRVCCFFFFIISAIWQTQSLCADDTIVIPGDNFFPEGIASDGKGGIYVGSLTQRKILHINLESKEVSIFADKTIPGLLSVFGLLVDREKGLLYVCSTDAGVAELDEDKVTSLLAFNIKNPKQPARYPLPGGGFCNDVALGPDGAVYVTDTSNPRILILRPEASTLDVWVENEMFGGEGINLNGLVWSGNKLYVVKSNSGELFQISQNAATQALSVLKIKTPRPLQFPDGLELLTNDRLLVVEGSGNLIEISIVGDEGSIRLISEGLDVPTTMEIIDGRAIVVQAQLDHLFDPEKAGKPAPFTIKVISLK